MELINGNDLYQMFNYAAYYIRQERIKLNDINVFPVADGDTGDNLLHTLQTIILESEKTESFSETLYSISNSALIGARGNSGVIFAQFVNGLLTKDMNKEQISIEEFTTLIENSYSHTVSSLSNPQEGTMITVIREWGNILKQNLPTVTSLKDFFQKSLLQIQKVLENTKTMMNILSEKDVVDSGAMGFVLFVKGIASYYNNDEINITKYEEIKIDHHHFDGEVTYRYCTEGLVKFDSFNYESISKNISDLGDSLIIAQGSERFRVHIHTNSPDLLFKKLKEFGTVETQKIDDMKLEMELKNSEKKRVLVVDSIADIDKTILDNNNVVVIPINISIDGIPYLDKLSISNELLFNELSSYKEYPKTATPSIKYLNDLFSKLLLRFDEVLVLTVSSKLSGTHDVIYEEARKLKEKGKNITVIDTYNNSATEGLLVLKAIELLNNDVPTKEIITTLEDYREKTQILVCLDTFKYATMSGRVPKVVGKIGMFLGMRPIMSLDNGKGTAYGFSFSKKGITKKIRKLIEKDLTKGEIESFSIVHCMNEELAKSYADEFSKLIGKAPEFITQISSATAIHSGVGSVAIGYIKK